MDNLKKIQASDYQRYLKRRAGDEDILLLVVSGETGFKVAQRALMLPVKHITVCPLLKSDIALLSELKKQPHRAGAINIADRVFDTYGAARYLCKYTMIAAATGRPHTQLYQELNQVSIRFGIPWTKLSILGHKISLGPTVIPGITACYQCCVDRTKANNVKFAYQKAMESFLDASPDFEFQGHLVTISNMAAEYLYCDLKRMLVERVPPITLGTKVTMDPLYIQDIRDFVPPMEFCRECGYALDSELDSNEFLTFVSNYA